jgi:hypothetical protein
MSLLAALAGPSADEIPLLAEVVWRAAPQPLGPALLAVNLTRLTDRC